VLSTSLRGHPWSATLPGTFSVDAVSPNARWLYLIERRSADIADYAVRAFDLEAGRLVDGDIVDRRNPSEKMAGYPVARAVTGNGRYVYTLYNGMGHESFVHALDTVDGSARCLDLPRSVPEDMLWNLRFGQASRGRLPIAAAHRAPVAWIDLATRTLHAGAAA
jgi:hypothetical protein